MHRGRTAIHLRVLETSFEILTNSDDWRNFLRQLWAPFISDPGRRSHPGTVTLSIEVGGNIHRAIGIDASIEDENPWQVAEWLRHRLVETAVSEADSIVDLHGAALVRDQTCLILAGPSGAGKTTLALALCAAGWRLLSDDLAPIVHSSGQVLPFPKPLSIKSIPRWREWEVGWSPPPWPVEPIGGLLVPATLLPLEANPHVPTHLVICQFKTGEPQRFETITAAEAAAESGQLVRQLNSNSLRCLVELAIRTRSARLSFSDASQAIDALGRFCRGEH